MLLLWPSVMSSKSEALLFLANYDGLLDYFLVPRSLTRSEEMWDSVHSSSDESERALDTPDIAYKFELCEELVSSLSPETDESETLD